MCVWGGRVVFALVGMVGVRVELGNKMCVYVCVRVCGALKSLMQLMKCSLLRQLRRWCPPEDASFRRETRTPCCFSLEP